LKVDDSIATGAEPKASDAAPVPESKAQQATAMDSVGTKGGSKTIRSASESKPTNPNTSSPATASDGWPCSRRAAKAVYPRYGAHLYCFDVRVK
jgi:hypothetical protein